MRCLSALWIIVAAALGLAACSSADLLNGLVPKDGYAVEPDVAYGAGPRRRLDIFRPTHLAADAPLVVFFYGGRWQEGAKEDFFFVGQALASRGYLVALPDYRLWPEVGWRGFVEDANAAVAFLARQEPGRPIILAGHSAGAYLAMMTALDGQALAAAAIEPCRVAAAIGLAGPYDFLPLTAPDLIDMFGPGEAGAETQPVTYASPDDPPVLLIAGTADSTVKPRNARSLAAQLQAVGVDAETRYYDDVAHVDLVASLAAPLRFLAPTLHDMDTFIHRVAGDPGPRKNCKTSALGGG